MPLDAIEAYLNGPWFRLVQIKCVRCPRGVAAVVWALGEGDEAYVLDYFNVNGTHGHLVLNGKPADMKIGLKCPTQSHHGTAMTSVGALRREARAASVPANSRDPRRDTPKSRVVRLHFEQGT